MRFPIFSRDLIRKIVNNSNDTMNNDSTFAASDHSARTDGGFSNPSHAQASQLEKIAADMRQSLKENQPEGHPDDQHGEYQRRGNHETTGPLREIMHHQDSLYRYLNWEDPLRTLGSYFLALGVLSAAHYFPWTRTALKYGSITLGVVSFTEFANRVFTENTLLARLRPREYATLNEATLNATLKDIHDLLQHLTVMAQKTILGEDLSSTFISFITITSLYLFSNLLSPFGIAILALTTAYIIPLFSTPRGKEVTRNAQIQAEKIGHAAAENGKQLAQQGQEKLSQGYAKAQEGAAGTKQATSNVLSSGKNAAANASNKTADAAVSTKNQAANTLQTGGQTTSNLTNTDSDSSFGAKNQTGNLFQSGSQSASNPPSYTLEKGAQNATQGVDRVPRVDHDFLGSGLGSGNIGNAQYQGTGFGQSHEKSPEEILDHSKVKSDLQGGSEKVRF